MGFRNQMLEVISWSSMFTVLVLLLRIYMIKSLGDL
jgi:hypothetical protein